MHPDDPSSPPEYGRSRRERREAADRARRAESSEPNADGQPGEPTASSGQRQPATDATDRSASDSPGEGSGRDDRRARRRRWPWIVGGVGVVLVGLVVVAGVLGVRFLHEARQAQAALTAAKSDITTLAGQVNDGDKAGAHQTAVDLTANVRRASHIVDGSLWNLAARLPGVGANIDAVQRVTRAVGILTDQALPPGLQLMSTIDLHHLTVKGGGIDLAPFESAQSSLPRISAAFQAANSEIGPVDTKALMPSVAGPIKGVLALIRQSAPTIDTVSRELPTLLDLAGAKGPQTYLVIFQNNAEIRATGGNPAASMVITVDHGKIHMGSQASSATFYQEGTGNTAWTNLPASMTRLYRSTFPIHSQDFTMTPDFPTTATLFGNLWSHTTGTKLDGVISIDPVVLSNLLAVAGPVTIPGNGQITSQNAVQMLLSEAYQRYPTGAESDAFFAAVAQRVFTHLVTTSWDVPKMWQALVTSAKEQRVYVNFTAPAAQAMAADAGVAGAVPSTTSAKTQLGMYLNDSSVGKLEYYLTTGIRLQCDAAARTVTETMTLHNAATGAINTSYVLGYRNTSFGLPRTTLMLDVLTMAPPGATIVAAPHGQIPAWNRSGTQNGNSGVSRTVLVPAGRTVTISSTVKLGAGTLGPLDLRYSPTPHATTVDIAPDCGALFPTSK